SDFTAGANQIGGTSVAGATSISAQNPAIANQMFNSQNYLELKSATMGSFKMGTINDASLYTSSASQPFGTAIGSGYSGSFARLNGTGVVNVVNTGALTTIAAGASGAGARLVRVGNSAMYETPTFNGFSGSLLHVFKNDNDQYATAGQQELGLKYNNGPINVHYAYYKIDAGNNVTAGGIVGTTVKHNMLGGNYTFGAATVMGGWTSSKGNAAAGTTVDARSWNIALKYAMGNWAFMANVLRVDDKMPVVAAVNGDQDRNLTGLGLDYSMSKRTTAYVRYENGDNDKSSNTGSNNGAFTRWAAGVRHSF
ncbi:MAG: porin, partial [Sulfuritalea sp.]|nr:porin [Sulfuritalea sp.]